MRRNQTRPILNVGLRDPLGNVQALIIEYVAACDALHEILNFEDFVGGWLAAQELSVSETMLPRC